MQATYSTLRVPIETKNSTYSRRSQTVSTVKKSQARIAFPCWRRNDRQLEHVLRVYMRHFNQQRPHRALDLRPPDRGSETDPSPRATVYPLRVRRRDLLGGLLHEYEAAA